MEAEVPVESTKGHVELGREMEEEIVGIQSEPLLRGDGFPEGVPADQVRVADRGDEDPRDGVGQEVGEPVPLDDGHAPVRRALLQSLHHPLPPEAPGPGEGFVREDVLEGDPLRPDVGGRLPEEGVLREDGDLHGPRDRRATIKGLGGGQRTCGRRPIRRGTRVSCPASPQAMPARHTAIVPRGVA